jgi:hypothetical protein
VISEEMIQSLKQRLVGLVNYQAKLRDEKKAMSASLGEQIKESQKKIDAIGQSLEKNDLSFVNDAFDYEDFS